MAQIFKIQPWLLQWPTHLKPEKCASGTVVKISPSEWLRVLMSAAKVNTAIQTDADSTKTLVMAQWKLADASENQNLILCVSSIYLQLVLKV